MGRQRLIFVKVVGTRNGKSRALYTCACGNTHEAFTNDVNRNKTMSCGCLRRETSKLINYKHGQSETAEFTAWQEMLARCYTKTHKNYTTYGGRGIEVCPEWRTNFQTFLKDMGTRPKEMTSLDRIDVNGPYSPNNCRWADQKTQNRNKRNNHTITHNNSSMCLSEWEEKLNFPEGLLKARLNLGWSESQAITMPHRKMRPRK